MSGGIYVRMISMIKMQIVFAKFWPPNIIKTQPITIMINIY